MLSNAIEPSNNWSLYPVNLVDGLCFDNYDEAAKKEREIFLSASESDHRSYKKSKPNNCSSRKNLFGSNGSINDSDSSDGDQPLMVIKKRNDEAKSLTGVQEESCNYSFEPNSLGSMSSIINYDKHLKTTLQKRKTM
ncbi:unnamed protein product [Macrosiphum euphorbiae]|uniref:Uncharacterized protein n=1 Tax=Macrosiphum euphorbiae TaxID=13131 RepID=A0AAV0XN04_9HEMI|nr:unnamed protein product [Macrosiphum euphorbiae]